MDLSEIKKSFDNVIEELQLLFHEIDHHVNRVDFYLVENQKTIIELDHLHIPVSPRVIKKKVTNKSLRNTVYRKSSS